MATQTGVEIYALRIDRTIRAHRSRVYAAFTAPGDLVCWATPDGLEVASGSLDLRVGGRWSVELRNPADDSRYAAEGAYREIVPLRKLVYTHWWSTDYRPVETTVTVAFHDDAAGTRLVLGQHGFREPENRDGHLDGWVSCFRRLERLLR